MIIGYTSGVYDLFHVGHLNLLNNAKRMCDKLVVGVTTDELAKSKGRTPIIPFCERIEIIKSIRCVDAVIPQYDMDKLKICKEIGAGLIFVGDDWYRTERWNTYEEILGEVDIKIIYLPYTQGISTTEIIDRVKQI